jgi:hypothetical protein
MENKKPTGFSTVGLQEILSLFELWTSSNPTVSRALQQLREAIRHAHGDGITVKPIHRAGWIKVLHYFGHNTPIIY